ncbi:MAG: hypothetical protein Q4B47_04975, partial [Eubacteriales bacterium]|nr:hypothetical protein [Eubacteriales bacterium]
MKNFIKIAALCSFLTIPVSVHADVLSYQEVTEINKQAGNTIPVFEIGDGAGTTVYMVERSDHFYINVKEVNVYASPGNTSNILGILKNGMEVDRTAVCSNGWSKVYWIDAGTKFSGYVPDSVLCEKHKIESVSETKVIAQDCEILDYPSKKDGEVSGKVSASQEVTKIEAIDSNWSKVSFSAENGEIVEGYILNSMFEPDEDEVPEDIVNTKEETTENTDDISGETAEDTEATSDKTAED